MSILKNPEGTTQSSGISKQIDENSRDVALDILQRGIYMYPIPSTIRELVSNSYDSINERETAKSILSGKSKIEDHFDVELVDGIYHTSGWNPNYFDLNWLSDDMNSYVLYEEGTQRDLLRIKDNGVGIGKTRMVGYFQLAWSSKRTQKGVIGKYGLGSKVALSLGIDSFTVISRYNGKKFKFQVFLDKIDSITPKFSNGKENKSITVQVPQDKGELKDYTMFYEDTTEKNGLELQIEIKKHNKKELFEAVESQLLYIPNVKFQHKKENAYSYDEIDIAAKVVYKDDNIVISESTLLNKPHILLGAGDGLINYGLIDFKTLELEPKSGAVGLILDINDVEVTPSRESVVWSSITRKAVIEGYNKVVSTATKLVNKDLVGEKDYLHWIKKAASIKNSLSSSKQDNPTVLQKLAGILDSDAIKNIKFEKGAFFKLFSSDYKSMFGTKLLVRQFEYDKYSKKIVRTKLQSVNTIARYNCYVTEGASNKYVDRYLYEEVENGPFIQIKLLAGWNLENTSNLIGNSNITIPYDSIVVPDDVKDRYIADEADGGMEDDEDLTVVVSTDPNIAAKLRKQNQEILYHEARSEGSEFVYTKREIKIKDIHDTFEDSTIVYGTFKDRDLMLDIFGLFSYYFMPQLITGSYTRRNFVEDHSDLIDKIQTKFNLSKISLILISEENEKHIKYMPNFIPVNKFVIKSYKDGILKFSDPVKFFMTLYLVNKDLHEFSKIPSGLDSVIANLVGNRYVQLNTIYTIFKQRLKSSTNSFYDKCINLQVSKNENVDVDPSQYLEYINDHLPESLCDYIDEIKDVDIIDLELLNIIREELPKTKLLKPLLNCFNYYTYSKEENEEMYNVIIDIIKNTHKFVPEEYDDLF